MPLQKIHWYGPGSGWGIWRVEEEEAALAGELPTADHCPDQIRFPRKRLEWLGGRYLMSRLFKEAGIQYQGLTKDENGKPFPIGSDYRISLSNAFPFVAARIDLNAPVGIDLEIPRLKMISVIPRVLSESEKLDAGQDMQKLCVYWSAKESMFKVFGKRNIHFAEHLLLDPFSLEKSGCLSGHILFPDSHWRVVLDYISGTEFVLTSTKSISEE